MSEFRSVVISQTALTFIILSLLTPACTNGRWVRYSSSTPTLYSQAMSNNDIGEPPNVISKIESLKFAGFDERHGYRAIKLKNVSQKNITAYSLVSQCSSTYSDSLGMTSLLPGRETFHMNHIANLNSDPDTNIIYINFAMFEDGTFEGDSNIANRVKINRSGKAKQLTAIETSLQKIIDEHEEISFDQFNTIIKKSETRQVIEKQYQKEFDSGAFEIRQRVLGLFSMITHVESQNRWFSSIYEQRITKLDKNRISEIKDNVAELRTTFHLYQ